MISDKPPTQPQCPRLKNGATNTYRAGWSYGLNGMMPMAFSEHSSEMPDKSEVSLLLPTLPFLLVFVRQSALWGPL